LEFDTVIVPGLGRPPRGDDRKLLHWLERGFESGGSDLLLAPISAEGTDKNTIEAHLQLIDKRRGHFENSRLLYVAATRAKCDLHLLGHTSLKETDDELKLNAPSKNSLLESLWPVLETDYQTLFAKYQPDTSSDEVSSKPAKGRSRLDREWSLPATLTAVQIEKMESGSVMEELVEFDWASETARHVGSVVHRLLQHIGEMGFDQVKPDDLAHFKLIGEKMLGRIGVPEEHSKDAVENIGKSIELTLEDERGQWILSGQHEQASCELALSNLQDGKIKHMIIDRTFIDEQGTRWIIDYKTSIHTGGGVDEFLDREKERYRHQLEGYANTFSKMEHRDIRCALYYPLLKGWREWSFQSNKI
ncbi:MAG: PD-(D/E)XK nuclease family protein, partial [Gammaproteobacteria bacterium]|nr:PD-(D/E)XK nuclease family protein [Gammaproteobacteria bacterium]